MLAIDFLSLICRIRRSLIFVLLVAMVPSCAIAFWEFQGRKLRPNEEIRFFATVGTASTGEVFFRGRVSQRERSSFFRKHLISEFANWLGLSSEETSSPFLFERGLLFFEEEAERVRVTLSLPEGARWILSSGEGGYFDKKVRIPHYVGKERYLRFLSEADDRRIFSGGAWILDDKGLSIISDIDDTAKVTEVQDFGESLRNTFTRPFQAVPGMAELFHRVLAHGGSLHFVSAGPFQMTPIFEQFFKSAGFPEASFHLRPFDLSVQAIDNFLNGTEAYKVQVIQNFFELFPERRFLLVGDSGQRDPEAYGKIWVKYRQQVVGIWIRDVTSEGVHHFRYQKMVQMGAPLRVFRSPEELLTEELFKEVP